ncbi:MAG: extracellular solute-binding protein, partial [Oscillospiraceae bacterium]
MKIKKVIAGTLAFVLIAGTFSACSGDASKTERENNQKITLAWWTSNMASKYVSSYNEIEAFKKVQEINNVEIEYIHPSVGQEAQQFNIMIASGSYPDLIDWNWSDEYIGGINKAVKDGVILDIDNKVKSSATNYLKKLNENPNFLKSVKTYDGKILTFNTIKDSPKVNSYYGPQIRKDWLDKLGLAVPKTIDEWHEVLMAFKTKDPNGNGKMDEIPFAEDKQMNFSAFSAAWGVLKGEFYKNPKGEFVYGSIEPEFKSYLETMNKWYSEGLIDSEFAAMPSKN